MCFHFFLLSIANQSDPMTTGEADQDQNVQTCRKNSVGSVTHPKKCQFSWTTLVGRNELRAKERDTGATQDLVRQT
jgi:hypothetical protein